MDSEKGTALTPLNIDQPQKEGQKTKQYIFTLVACLGAFTAGTILAWTSPAIPKLQTNGTSILDEPLSKSDGGWVGAFVPIGALIGALPTGFLTDKIGRRWTMVALGGPFILSWVLLTFAANVGTLYVGRLFAGIATGGSCVAIPMYIGEIVENSVRGSLGSYFQLLLTVGILYTYVVGSLVDYFWLGMLSCVIPVAFVILLFFLPETPSYLLLKNKRSEAEKTLTILRGPDYDVKRELDTLQEELDEAASNKGSIKDLFASKANINALIVGLCLMIFQQLSGVNAVIFYTSEIFASAGSTLSADNCSIVVGVVQVIATAGATVLVKHVGRRVLLLLSGSVMCGCLIILGVYFHMKEQDAVSVENIAWLPLLCVTLFIITFSLGYGPLPWMMMSELFASSIKSVAAALAVTLNWTLAFVVTKTFVDLVASIGTAATLWGFSAITLIGIIFIFFRVPETKGRTLIEIQRELGGR